MVQRNAHISFQSSKRRITNFKIKLRQTKRLEIIIIYINFIHLHLGTCICGETIHFWKRGTLRGGICPCRHCRRQCKFFASGVNFSIFTHLLCFFLLKLLKLGEIDGVKFLAWKSDGVNFLTNSMSALCNIFGNDKSRHEICPKSYTAGFSG